MSDMFAAADEPRAQITGLYKKAWAHSDATIEALPLDAIGRVPHWPDEHSEVTLHRIMVYVDTSAAMKLLVEEKESAVLADHLQQRAQDGNTLAASLLLHTEGAALRSEPAA